MSLTDSYVLFQAQYHLLENAASTSSSVPTPDVPAASSSPASAATPDPSTGDADGTFTTSMFDESQFIAALNDRQRRFLKDTGVVAKWGIDGAGEELGGQAQISRYKLPSDWIETRRLTWTDSVDLNTYSLERSDAYELDATMSDWGFNSGPPIVYHESTIPTRTVEIAPAPRNAGQLGIIYTALSTVLDGSGIAMTVPDVFVPAIMWGAIGDLLGQDGEGHDPQRASYCYQRYDQGVELARLMLRSNIVTGAPA